MVCQRSSILLIPAPPSHEHNDSTSDSKKTAFQPYETILLRSVDKVHSYTTTRIDDESDGEVHGEVAERDSTSNLGRCRGIQSASDGIEP